MDEAGDQSMWTRLASLIMNKKDDIDSYSSKFEENATLEERQTTEQYYDLATDFYEYGWGSSFHFAARYQGETLAESIKRHEHFLAMKLGLKAGHKVADLGMGVGGPLRAISKFSGAHVTGVTINNYQVRRAKLITQQRESKAAAKNMAYVHGDFTDLVPKVFAPESLDAVYYIESACHLSNRTEIFLESAKALKKGGRLFNYEWVMTDRFDPNNETHLEIKKGVEYGNGIQNLVHQSVPLKALEASGFRILEHGDLVDIAEEMYGDHNVPWYFDIGREWSFESIEGFKLSKFGQNSLAKVLWMVEKIGLVPKGAVDTEAALRQGGGNLVRGGQTKIFTPMYYILAEKL
jgi:sterol 24-C-methyltransferase